ncbi:hypothetical protein F8M41_021723 [Gigaspora margarita]|uniref:Uncharacterized protein n=1 Tax=Gigaspora margarita TaxID=4874 RepID=A0A8H4AG90_GIGMA|nr:hypothetical protein F8M41_021723 [Gigaspora margarita]
MKLKSKSRSKIGKVRACEIFAIDYWMRIRHSFVIKKSQRSTGIGVENDEKIRHSLIIKPERWKALLKYLRFTAEVGVEKEKIKAFIYDQKSAEMDDASEICVGRCYDEKVGSGQG